MGTLLICRIKVCPLESQFEKASLLSVSPLSLTFYFNTIVQELRAEVRHADYFVCHVPTSCFEVYALHCSRSDLDALSQRDVKIANS